MTSDVYGFDEFKKNVENQDNEMNKSLEMIYNLLKFYSFSNT